MEDPKAEVKDSSVEDKINEIEKIVNKHLVSGPPTT